MNAQEGRRLLKAECWAAAADTFRTALALDPSAADTHRGLSVALRELGQMDEAIVAARQAVELAGEAGAQHAHLARLLLGAGKLEDADLAIERALALLPADETLRELRDRSMRLKARQQAPT